MSVKLTIEITGPLDPEDRDLLSGVAVMTLAIANHEMAKNAFPETFRDDDEPDAPAVTPGQPVPCAHLDTADPNRICIAESGHRGRHQFRAIAAVDADGTTARAN